MSKELLKLIEENPNLPIYAYVEPDVVQDDSHYWAGKLSSDGEIREFIELDYSYTHIADCDWLFRDDTEEWEEYMLENYLEDNFTEEEANKKIEEELENIKWKKGIFIYVHSL